MNDNLIDLFGDIHDIIIHKSSVNYMFDTIEPLTAANTIKPNIEYNIAFAYSTKDINLTPSILILNTDNKQVAVISLGKLLDLAVEKGLNEPLANKE